ncbi:uncharacterized protein [Palaemon carinicauda]|uniref:uncharacterized protein n=1 Tax=Palaemon carinicauda TaxID=392227 RepID=UPI0035B6AA3A
MSNPESRCETCRNCSAHDDEASEKCTCSCQATVTCTCKCNVGNWHDIAQKISAVVGGCAVCAGGIAATVFTGGTALPIAGAMASGAGMSSAIHGLVKTWKGEKICGKDFGIDVGVGFATGIIGGGGAAATESAASVVVKNVAKEGMKRGALKLGVRTAGGIASSVVTTAVRETADCSKGNKEWREFGNDPETWYKGIAFGAVNGIGGHVVSNVSKLSSTAQTASTQTTGTQRVKGNSIQSKQSSNSKDIISNLQSKEKQEMYISELKKTSLTAVLEFRNKVNEENEDWKGHERYHCQ